ncbi:MAG: carboxylesterase family protein [Bacteroidetes bacterium]|nr:carboxylesterase family protein [Bacteroidota bacterium]
MKKGILFLFPIIVCFAVRAQSGPYCIQGRFSETALFDSTQIEIARNVVFATPRKWPGSGTDTLKLDVYAPKAGSDPLSTRPCIVFFYGGAWLTGSKNDAGIQQKCFEWARRGFVAIAPQYRLGWSCNAADLLQVCVLCQGVYYNMNTAVYRGAQDGRAAMQWVVHERQTWKIDTSALFIGGESAGSFNAMHTAWWTPEYGKKAFNAGPYKILGNLDSAGLYPGTPFRIRAIINSCGAVASDTALKKAAIPMVAFHDNADCVVPYQTNQVLNCCATSFFWARGSKNLYDDLTAAGVASELHTVPGAAPQHCSYPSMTLVKESSCFLKQILCGLQPSGSSIHPVSPAVSCNALRAGIYPSQTQGLRIYPVPAAEMLEIQSTAGDIAGIVLFDAQGRQLNVNCLLQASKARMSVTEIPGGIYTVKAELKSSRYTLWQKILIQH